MPNTYSAAPDLASLLDGSSAVELIPELATRGLQQLIELELAAFLGADWHERTDERLGYRNGYRSRTLTTQVGDLALQIPKLRAGSFLPTILEPRRRVDQALYAVIMEAYIGGVSTRKVDSLVSALGSQSQGLLEVCPSSPGVRQSAPVRCAGLARISWPCRSRTQPLQRI
jgi:putative transposase